jgi:hypothetical protein
MCRLYFVQSVVAQAASRPAVYFALAPPMVTSGEAPEFFRLRPGAWIPGSGGRCRSCSCRDLPFYWQHRLFHTRVLWPVHAVHYLAAARLAELGSSIP